jgi:hypothetical protein
MEPIRCVNERPHRAESRARLCSMTYWRGYAPNVRGSRNAKGTAGSGSPETGPCLRNQHPGVTKIVYPFVCDEGTGT